MYDTVKALGLTVNESTMVGLVKAPPSFSEGWTMFDLETRYYHTASKNVITIDVPIMTRNTRDAAVISKWVQPQKQLLIRGNFISWNIGDTQLAVALVPHLLKLGPQVTEGSSGLYMNSCLFTGRVSVPPVLNAASDYNHMQIETEFVEKQDNGFSESVTTIPIAIPFKSEINQQLINKLYTPGRQLMIIANYAFYRDMEGNTVPGFVSKLISTGAK